MSKLDIHGAAGASPSALHARLSSERPSAAILLATGSPGSPLFTEALFEDAGGALLRSSSTAVSGSEDGGGEEEEKGKKGPLAHVVGPGELGIRGSEKDSVAAGRGGDEDEDRDDEGGDGAADARYL